MFLFNKYNWSLKKKIIIIQSECDKIRTRETPNMDTFHAQSTWWYWNCMKSVNFFPTLFWYFFQHPIFHPKKA